MDGVQFDEDRRDGVMPRIKPVTMADALMRSGIVSSPGQAMVILSVIAFVCISATIYFLASAVPPEPAPLGHDILRPGETVPSYVHE